MASSFIPKQICEIKNTTTNVDNVRFRHLTWDLKRTTHCPQKPLCDFDRTEATIRGSDGDNTIATQLPHTPKA